MSLVLQEGFLIEIYHNKQIICAYCFGQHNSVLQCITEEGREIKLPRDKVLSAFRCDELKNGSRDEIKKYLVSLSRERDVIKQAIPIRELWEFSLLERDSYTVKDLASFYFGDSCSEDEFSAMRRLLLADHLYFKRKDDLFFPQSAEYVESLIHKMDVEKDRKDKNERLADYFRKVMSGIIPPMTPEVEDIIPSLIDVAVKKSDSQKYKETMSVFQLSGITSNRAAFDILVKVGIFSADENLLLRYYEVETEFPDDVTDECRRVITADSSASYDGYDDFTNLNVISIDDEYTKDVDDAINVEKVGDNYHVAVHIADISRLVRKDSLIDIEAKKRGTSIYLPDLTINMLPPALPEDKAGLVAGQGRCAMSFCFVLDPQANLLDFSIKKSIIKVSHRYRYDDGEELLAKDSDVATLYALASMLLKKRLEKGAVYAPFPRVVVHVSDGLPVIKKDLPTAPLQILVSEFMILANSCLGEYCFRNNIPAFFRNQETPKEKVPEDMDLASMYNLHQIRKYLKKVCISTESHGHYALGISHYVQATSPLRRYMDLVMQRQVKHFIDTGKPLYTVNDLGELILELDLARSTAEHIERKSKHYWILKYLEQLGRTEQRAIVLRLTSRGIHVQLCDLLLEAEVPRPHNVDLHPGMYIYVMPEIVWPYDYEVKLTFSGIE